jgi:hypothetical protein
MGLGLRSLHFVQPLTGIIESKGVGVFAEALAMTLHCRLSYNIDRSIRLVEFGFSHVEVKRVEQRRAAGA